MKKSIILGICVTSIILLLVPTIPAQQYNQAIESYQINFENQIDLIPNKLQNFDSEINDKESYKLNIINDINLIIEYFDSFEYYYQTSFIGFILNTIIALIFTFFGTIFGILFGPILSVLIQLLTAPAVILAKIISLLFGNNSINLA